MVTTLSNNRPKYWVIVPTFNPGNDAWADWIGKLKNQICQPNQVVVVDSGSKDGSLSLSQRAGFTLLHVQAQDFNHGGTRQWALDQALSQSRGQLEEPEFVVFLTQDALLATQDALQDLLLAFQDQQVAATYGRQIAKPQSSWLEVHARAFNYPESSRTVQLKDKESLGIKACFLSNSFAAYRLQALQSQGGFPTNLPLGEDTYIAAKLLLSGKSLRYQASSVVYHSHNYNLQQDFQRMFDTGVFHAQNLWLLNSFGSAERAGVKLVVSQWEFLSQFDKKRDTMSRPNLLVGVLQIVKLNINKLMAYRLGKAHRFLPVGIKAYLSMSKYFWQKQ
jgi:rhamnosyltransferase